MHWKYFSIAIPTSKVESFIMLSALEWMLADLLNIWSVPRLRHLLVDNLIVDGVQLGFGQDNGQTS